MLSDNLKRYLSFVLALVMILSISPITAYATEIDLRDNEQKSEIQNTVPNDSVDSSETELTEKDIEIGSEVETETQTISITSVQQFQTRIDTILTQYSITGDMSDDDIYKAIVAEDGDIIKTTIDEVAAMEQDGQDLTAEEFESLENLEILGRFISVMDALYIPAIAKSVDTGITGLAISDSLNTISISSGTITATAKGGLLSKKTNTITITNNSDNAAILSFDYAITSANSFNVAGDTSKASGTYSKVLDAGSSITITITSNSGFSNLTVTLTMSKLSLITAATESNVTFNYDSTLGSITVDGAAVSSGVTHEVSLSDEVALVATPKANVTFLGWINETTGERLSANQTHTLKFAADTTVKAVFINSTSVPWFLVNNSYLFDDLNSAAGMAGASKVVLMNSAILPAGDYTIPSGVTLLIPFDTAHTLYTTQPGYVEGYTNPSVYRTLTMAEGANIKVEGAMSVSGKHNSSYGNQTDGSAPCGPLGFVKMSTGSTITVENGASLYAWGYITGSGAITVKSGASVYEVFQIADYHGGSNTSDMASNSQKVFPISQYYIQNIEVPMTLYSGATEYGYATVHAKFDYSSTIEFIGDIGNNSEAMIQLSSGYIVKQYDGTTDRLLLNICGDVTLSSISLKMGDWGKAIDSKDYNLPLNGNMTITFVKGTATAKQDIALLPGIQINVLEEATLKIASGYSVYAYDLDDWDAYCGFDLSYSKFIPARYAPGRSYTRTEADLTDAIILVNGTLDATEGSLYSTSGGATVYSSDSGVAKIKAGAKTSTYQYRGKDRTYITIPITSVKLTHGDGTQLQSETNDYYYGHGVWYAGEHTVTSTITEPTCTGQGYTTHSCTCGYEVKDTYTVANGHSSADPVVENIVHPTATNLGSYDAVIYCTTCGEKITSEEKTLYTKLAAIEASADSEILLRLKCFVPTELVEQGAYAEVTKVTLWDNKAQETETEKIVLSELTTDNGGRYVLSKGMASGEMTCPMTVRFFDGNGNALNVLDYADNTVSDSVTRTVLDYAKRILEVSKNEKQRAVTSAMVTYGGYAQLNFEVDSQNPVYSILGDEAPSLSSVTITDTYTDSGDDIGISLDGRQAYLDSAIYLRSYFKLTGNSTVDDYTFTLTYTENGTEKTKALQPVPEMKTKSGVTYERYYVDILDIPAAYLDYMYKITVTHNETGKTYELNTSVNAYLKDLIDNSTKTEQINSAKAMYLYNQAANNFFGK